MSRYQTTRVLKPFNKKRRFATTIYPVVPRSDNDIYLEISAPDRLDKLALKFYNDSQMWWVIAIANGIGKGSYMVPAGITIRIPDISNITDYLENENLER